MARSQAWKACERRIAEIVGGRRVIAEKGVRAGVEDVKHSVFSIESKHGKSVISAFIRKAYEQCVKNAGPNKIPLVVLHQSNSKRYYAFLDLEHLVELLKERADDGDIDAAVHIPGRLVGTYRLAVSSAPGSQPGTGDVVVAGTREEASTGD